MNRKIIVNIIAVLLILSIPLILYLLNFRLILSDTDFYEAEFEKHGVYERFGKEDVDKTNSGLLAYFEDGRKNSLHDDDFFDFGEKRHLLDVKNAVQAASSLLVWVVCIVIFLLILFYFTDFKRLTEYIPLILIFSGAVTLIFGLILLVFVRLNFDLPFAFLHKMLFEEGTWLFSGDSNLIGMYPIGFFYDFSRSIFFNAALHGFVLVLIGFLIRILLLGKIIKKERYLNIRKKKKINKK
ncbi:DUF1461 domain-containing protein [Candidatus Woesearchaeota archaeon]|nr:DUF1461 domain-containing protein [Candidatus Woesearchaeota archaeon]